MTFVLHFFLSIQKEDSIIYADKCLNKKKKLRAQGQLLKSSCLAQMQNGKKERT